MGNKIVGPEVFKDQKAALNALRQQRGLKPVDSMIDAMRGRSAAKARKQRDK